MRAQFIRTKFLTGSPVQLKYLSLVVVAMFIPALFVGGCLYYLIFTILAEQIGIPEFIAASLIPAVHKINAILMVSVPFLFLALILWAISLSHRFSGPLERLNNELARISKKGDYTRRIHLRKHDDMKPLADAINHLLDKIEGKVT